MKGEPDTKQFENKSYRFSAYRSMFFWLDKRKGSKKYRRALPACLGKTVYTLYRLCINIFSSVTHVRKMYPNPENVDYVGLQPSSPVIGNKRRRRN